MLSLGKLAPGQQQYYLDTVARGAEEYYTGAKEAPGQSTGTYRLTAAHSARAQPPSTRKARAIEKRASAASLAVRPG